METESTYRSLTKTELHIMNLLWDKGEATINELMETMPEPHPPYTTVQTVVRILEKKNVVKATPIGRQHHYSPIMTRDMYMQGFMEETRKVLFRGSFSAIASFFAERERLAADEIERIIAILRKNQKSEPQGCAKHSSDADDTDDADRL